MIFAFYTKHNHWKENFITNFLNIFANFSNAQIGLGKYLKINIYLT